jgi:hypothetical protein
LRFACFFHLGILIKFSMFLHTFFIFIGYHCFETKEKTMKNFWKWILGIVIVLVVLFGLGIGARLLMANSLPARVTQFEGFRSPMMGDRGFDHFDGRMPSMGMTHFGGGFMLLGWLFPLALIGLLAYGAYRLGKRRTMVLAASTPPAPPAVCPKCGQPVQEGWIHCPACGKKQ